MGITIKHTVGASTVIRGSLKNSCLISVYEGLPHQMFEAELLETECEREDVIRLHEFYFYLPKNIVNGQTADLLCQFLSDEDSVGEFVGEKLCGGFHPDYAINWQSGNDECLAMVCFGCGEVIYCSHDSLYRYELLGRVEDKLKKLLKGFASKRPKRLNG
ncbi:MAG: hypothetical protein AAGH99_11445 [Planctomycetota bacterium]